MEGADGMARKQRKAKFEACPGCIAVDVEGRECQPGDARYCPIGWFNNGMASTGVNVMDKEEIELKGTVKKSTESG